MAWEEGGRGGRGWGRPKEITNSSLMTASKPERKLIDLGLCFVERARVTQCARRGKKKCKKKKRGRWTCRHESSGMMEHLVVIDDISLLGSGRSFWYERWKTNFTSVLSMSLEGRLEAFSFLFFFCRRAGTGHRKRLDSIAWIESGAATGRRDLGSDLTKHSSVFDFKPLVFFPFSALRFKSNLT